jgi:HlyD family secretion protein
MTSKLTTAARPAAPPLPVWRRRWAVRLLKALPVLLLVALATRQRFFVPVGAHRHVVERGDVVREVFGRGTLESRREVDLGFDLVGRISDLLVDEGDLVKLGQVVGHLAPEQFTADVRTASSGISLARSAIARLDAEERRASATLAFAESEEGRIRSLAASGSVSARDLDLAVQQLALARAEIERVRAARDEARGAIAVASGTADVRAVTAARAVLVSPFDGMVVRRLRDPGATVTVGTSVLRVVATDALWSRVWLDETTLPDLHEGQPTRVRLGGRDVTIAGKVDQIGRESDRQTHELLVDILLAEVPRRVAMGQRADAWVEVERRANVVRIPIAFVHRGASGTWCWVDHDGRIGTRAVVLGVAGTDLVEITSGLSAGDVVLDAVTPGGELPAGRRWATEPP